jgi:thiamine biosynthesis lipoprotein
MVWDLRFRAMGTQAHVLIEGPPELLPLACREIDRLDRLWSRFIAESDVSRLNRAAGAPVKVAPATVELIGRAAEGWRLTEGLFDPTLLNEIVAAGYDRDFDDVRDNGGGPASDATPLRPPGPEFPVSVDVESSTASVAAEVGFDSGGIGKGLGADLVAAALRREGASAAIVNLGGDLRAAGAPASGPWKVGLDNPFDIGGPPAVQLVLRDGALATSTTLVRRWKQRGEERHHLIDPRTGRPCESDVASVSVVADCGWRAEALAKAALLVGVDRALPLLAANSATGLVVDWRGRVHAAPGIQTYLSIPERRLASIALKDRAVSRFEIRLPAR